MDYEKLPYNEKVEHLEKCIEVYREEKKENYDTIRKCEFSIERLDKHMIKAIVKLQKLKKTKGKGLFDK